MGRTQRGTPPKPPVFAPLALSTPPQITLSGLMMVLLNFATLLYYDPAYLTEKGGAAGPPHWLYFT